SEGPPRSSVAIPVTGRAGSALPRSSAPVSFAISPTVIRLSLRKNDRALMQFRPGCDPPPGSECRPAAETEELGAIVRPLCNRIGEVEPQRSEWRCPEQARTHG